MKTTLTILFFLMFSLGCHSQSSNQIRLDQLTTEMDAALAKGDYETAAKLKEEKVIRIEIEEAIKNQDFEKAERLRASLDNSNTETQTSTTISTEQSEKPTKSVKEKAPVSEPDVYSKGVMGKKRGYFIADFSPAGFSTFQAYSTFSTIHYALQIKLGSNFYLNSNDSKARVGIGVNWISIAPMFRSGSALINFSPLKPGFIFGYAINDKIGIDAGFNFGADFLMDPYNEWTVVGLNFNPHLKLILNKFTLGIDYQNILGLTDYVRMNYFGFTLGIRR